MLSMSRPIGFETQKSLKVCEIYSFLMVLCSCSSNFSSVLSTGGRVYLLVPYRIFNFCIIVNLEPVTIEKRSLMPYPLQVGGWVTEVLLVDMLITSCSQHLSFIAL